ncbi:MAG: hypothetical protein JWM18_576 [Chloroflexi bacterium]|jgi:uncharacterized protein|nr:hypothetical protein [Chloroflexota bacterium]
MRTSEAVVVGAAPDRAVLYDPPSMALIRGPRDALERGLRYSRLGHGEEDVTEDDRRLWAGVETALERHQPLRGDGEPAVVRKLFLGNTYHCNMGCTYCYNELAIKDRKGSEVPEGMSVEVARMAVDALLAQAASTRDLQLVFVGGEPLLERETLFATVEYAERRCGETGHRVSSVVYTNGTLMTRELIAWADTHEVSLVVSLDGPPALNDRRRIFLSGRPTSRAVLRNIRRLVESSTQPLLRVRAVAVEDTALVPLHRYLMDLGFNEIHVQPMYDDAGLAGAETTEQLVELLDWYRTLLLDGVVISVLPFEGVIERMLARGGAVASWYPCSAGRGQLAVGPRGQLYPCHHFLEESRFQMGDVRHGLPTFTARQPFFLRVDQREPCRSCWARHACGGECYHRAHTAGHGYTGVIPEVCRSRKTLIGLTLEVLAEVAERRPDVLGRILRRECSPVPPNWAAYDHRDLTPYL